MSAKTKRPSASAKTTPKTPPEIPLAEWVVSVIGMLLVGFTLGYLVYAAVTRENRPPDIHVELLSITPQRDGSLVRFRATNRGDASANDVQILGTHRESESAEPQESQAALDFLPGRSQRTGGLLFPRPVTAPALQLHAAGYQDP